MKTKGEKVVRLYKSTTELSLMSFSYLHFICKPICVWSSTGSTTLFKAKLLPRDVFLNEKNLSAKPAVGMGLSRREGI